ncbi:hypothetical protein ACFC0I_42155, partial [Streptomyces sp. NPDC056227]
SCIGHRNDTSMLVDHAAAQRNSKIPDRVKLRPVSHSRRAVCAQTRTALSWYIACDRDLIAELLAILSIRIASTGPSSVFVAAVARPESTA